MRNSREQRWEEYLLPIDLIEAVACGELEACNHAVNEFRRYIEKVCTRRFLDEYGQSRRLLDQNMVEAVEQKLLYALAYRYQILPQES